jgi:CBS domain-containing protein
MRCNDVMKHEVETCWMMDSVTDVANRMRARGVGFIPVCNDASEVVGTITDRDLTIRVLAQGLPYNTPVHRVMSTSPITCMAHDDLTYAEDLMRRYHKSRIVCVDDRMRPIGVISLSDVADAEYAWRSGRVLREVSSRETSRYANG